MVEKIVSHSGIYHEDDLLGVSLLLSRFPNAIHETVHPQRVPSEYLENPEIVLVDVGGSYDPDKNNYDHHQNSEIESSFLLVLKHFFPEYYEKAKGIPEIQFLDHKDRFGFPEASKKFGVPHDKLYAVFLSDLLKKMGPNPALGEAFLKWIDESVLLMTKLQKIETKEIAGKVVALVPDPLPGGVVFEHTDADIVVMTNQMNQGQSSVIKNTAKPTHTDIDLSKLKEKYPVVFLHKAGFIAVIDKPFDELKNEVENIVKVVSGE